MQKISKVVCQTPGRNMVGRAPVTLEMVAAQQRIKHSLELKLKLEASQAQISLIQEDNRSLVDEINTMGGEISRLMDVVASQEEQLGRMREELRAGSGAMLNLHTVIRALCGRQAPDRGRIMLDELGRGGMGRVVRCYNLSAARFEAVKLLNIPPAVTDCELKMRLGEKYDAFIADMERRKSVLKRRPDTADEYDFVEGIKSRQDISCKDPGIKKVLVYILDMWPRKINEAKKAFDHEVSALVRLDKHRNPNIIKIFGNDDDRVYMELIRGRSLEKEIAGGRGGRLEVAKAAVILRQIVNSLKTFREEGIMHLDLKPCNIFLVDGKGEGDRDWVKLLDFGSSRLPEYVNHQMTLDQFTPEYAAPERFQGNSCHESDIWSLGVIFYQMLVGCTPFSGPLTELKRKVTIEDLPDIDGIRRDIPLDYKSLIRRMMSKKPGDRPVLEEIERNIGEILT